MHILQTALCVGGTAVFLFLLGGTFAFAAEEGGAEGILRPIAELVYYIASSIGGVFIGLGGSALDIAIQELIIKFGALFNTTFGQGVVETWQIIRDFFNILFIFAFIFLGIRTILNSEDSGTRKGIGNLIIAALFINFSLFISQAIIDFSNVAATQLYNHIANSGQAAALQDANSVFSISGAFVDIADLADFFGGGQLLGDDSINASKIFVYSILMLIFFTLAGFIFLFAAIHIIYRFVALILYMIGSPLLFLGLILPNFKSYTSKWLHGLLKQSFFAPAFLFLIYVSLVAMTRLKELLITDSANFAAIAQGGSIATNEFTIFLFFGITIGFIYASVKVGDFMGIAGAGTALKMIGNAQQASQRFVGGATFGAFGGLGRTTIGKWANDYAESDKAKNAASRGGLSGKVARIGLKSSRVVGDASFDMRRGTALGKPVKGGYKTQTEAIEKKEKAFAKSLDEVDDEDTQVQTFLLEKESYEAQLKELKHNKEGAKDEQEKKAIAVQITAVEDSIRKTDENIKREKNRRQIGVDANPMSVDLTKERFIDAKKEKDRLKGEFATQMQLEKNAKDEVEVKEAAQKKRELADKIVAVNKKMKELSHEAKKESGTLGYAGVLEERGFWGSAVLGRVTAQDHDAGKAIRKQYEKAAKKTKRDVEQESLKEAIEKSAKKD